MLNIKTFLGCMKTDPTVYWPIFITIVTFSTGAAFTISSIKRMIEHFKVIYIRLECLLTVSKMNKNRYPT